MKKVIVILTVIFTIQIFSQQSRFIIGAEHVSSFSDFNGAALPHSKAYWDTVKSLGLNYVGLKYFQQYSGSTGTITVDNIKKEIDSAKVRDMDVYLTNGFDRDASNNTYYPKRWAYQVEKVTGNSFNNFSNV